MLLRSIDILYIEPCTAEEGKIRLRASLSDDVTPVMPYLGSLWRAAEYNPAGPSVTLKRGPRVIGLHPREVTVTKLENTTDAWETLEWLRSAINAAWERRHELSPACPDRRAPGALEVWRLLPRTNCRRCGELTCMAFAARLVMGEQRLSGCPALGEAGYATAREALEELVGEGAW